MKKDWWIIILGISFIILWFLTPNIVSWGICHFGIIEIDKKGQFGDQFGAINALFSGFALISSYIQSDFRREN